MSYAPALAVKRTCLTAALAALLVGPLESWAIFPTPDPGFGVADYNGDGSNDLLDLDILGRNFGKSPATFAEGDSNGDNRVDLLDLDVLGANFGGGTAASAAIFPPIAPPCDFNGDNTCDLLDLDILGSNYGLGGPGLPPIQHFQGDANEDGRVDLLDLDILGRNFGAGGGLVGFATPEPASALLLAIGFVCHAGSRRRGTEGRR